MGGVSEVDVWAELRAGCVIGRRAGRDRHMSENPMLEFQERQPFVTHPPYLVHHHTAWGTCFGT